MSPIPTRSVGHLGGGGVDFFGPFCLQCVHIMVACAWHAWWHNGEFFLSKVYCSVNIQYILFQACAKNNGNGDTMAKNAWKTWCHNGNIIGNFKRNYYVNALFYHYFHGTLMLPFCDLYVYFTICITKANKGKRLYHYHARTRGCQKAQIGSNWSWPLWE